MVYNNRVYKNRVYENFNKEFISQSLIIMLMTMLFACLLTIFSVFFATSAMADEFIEPDLRYQKIDIFPAPAEITMTRAAFSLIGEPKYSTKFDHFDYVNPDAPKGGMIKLAEIGNYDNFNRYASRGTAESDSGTLYETLFVQSADELTSYYPLLATSITYSDKYQWAEVTINPNAYFSDGKAVTAEDVEFTFDKFMTEGVSQYRVYYQGVTVKAVDKHRVLFELPQPNREKLFNFIGGFRVLPKHFWQDKNLAEPLTTPPIGSAPYIVSDYKIGQYVIYQRDENYWGRDLAVNKGKYNFDYKRIDYYLDDSVALEAFKAGEYDFRSEAQPKNWFSQYQGQYFDDGLIIKAQNGVRHAVDTRWLAFNMQREIFKDVKVRQALTLAFDFTWLNHSFYYDSFLQPTSFFANTPYAARGKPTDGELAWLKPYADIIPESVFNEIYFVPPSDGKGFNRTNLLAAKTLLEEAGWIVKNNRLINKKTGQPFEFELLAYTGSDIKYAIPYQQHLARLGIKMTISTVDYAQITRRLRERDYDMMPTRYVGIDYPTSELMIMWGSQYLNSSWNASGLHSQAIDELIAQIPNYIDDQAELINLTRSLDRILTHEYPMIPMWSSRYIYYAYWNKFASPSVKPIYSIGLNTWWYDVDKVANLPKNNE